MLLLIASLMLAAEAPSAGPGDGAVSAEDSSRNAPAATEEKPSHEAPASSWSLSLLMRYGPESAFAEPADGADRSVGLDEPFSSSPPGETAFVLPPLDTSSSPRDPWLAYDKLQHVTFGLLGTLSAQYVLTEKAGASSSTALGISAGTAAAASVGKEFYDRRDGRFFSFRDLVADTLGIGLAAGIIVL